MNSKEMGTTWAIILVLALLQVVQSDYGWNQNVYPDWRLRPNISHSLIVGKLGSGDRLLHRELIKVHSRLFSIVEYNISYPSHGTSPFNITYMAILDMDPFGTGGYPSIEKGGVGSNFTQIHLTSRRNFGLNFNVSIYGS